jgi:putative ABC transport system permease protein
VWQDLTAGAVLLSEPLARQRQLTVGDSVQLTFAGGNQRQLAITDLVTDFTPDGGRISMLRRTAEDLGWSYRPSGIALRFPQKMPEAERKALRQQLASELADYPIGIQNSEELRALSLDLFDRTFTITTVLQVLTALVAAAGMVVAGMAHQFERRREWAMLRSMGASGKHMRRILMSGQMLLGFGAGIAAIPFGIVMAWLLASVINVRSFGWSLQLSIAPMLCLQTLVIAVVTAAIAGWLPARHINQTPLPEAMRWE